MSIPIQFQWWQFQFNSNYDNSNSIPIPELEFAINSNSGAELTPALVWTVLFWVRLVKDSHLIRWRKPQTITVGVNLLSTLILWAKNNIFNTFALSDHLKDCMVTSSLLSTIALRHSYSWLRALLMYSTFFHCDSDRRACSNGLDRAGSWVSNSFT